MWVLGVGCGCGCGFGCGVGRVGWELFGLDWIGLGWDWDWIGMGWDGMGCTESGCEFLMF